MTRVRYRGAGAPVRQWPSINGREETFETDTRFDAQVSIWMRRRKYEKVCNVDYTWAWQRCPTYIDEQWQNIFHKIRRGFLETTRYRLKDRNCPMALLLCGQVQR